MITKKSETAAAAARFTQTVDFFTQSFKKFLTQFDQGHSS